MSYFYKSDGTFEIKNNVYEHFNFCIKGVCITNESKNEVNACTPTPSGNDIESQNNCPVCTSCDTFQCPILNPCPICKDVEKDEEQINNESKLTEPYIIHEQLDQQNSVILLKKYIAKLSQFSFEGLGKYIMYNEMEDISLLMNSLSYLNVDYILTDKDATFGFLVNLSNMNVINDFTPNLLKVYDITQLDSEQTYDFLNARQIKNPPENIVKINNYIAIQVNFRPHSLDNIYESFEDTHDITGSYLIEIYDLKIQDYEYRYLSVILNNLERINITNALEYNVPFEVSYKNDNLPPNYFDIDKVYNLANTFLRKLFIKPDVDSYIFYENSNSNNLFEELKERINLIEYNEQETNQLLSEINLDKEKTLDYIRSINNPKLFGDILDVKASYKFTFFNKVFKSDNNRQILMEEIENNQFFLTFGPKWGDISTDIKVNDILEIRVGDTDTASAIPDKYFDIWRVLDVTMSTLTLSNVGYFDKRNEVDVSLFYNYFDTDDILPMPSSLQKAKDILTNYNFGNYDNIYIIRFVNKVKELITRDDIRIVSRDDVEKIIQACDNLSTCNSAESCSSKANDLLNILLTVNMEDIPITILCDNDPNIIIIKFYLFYIHDLELSDFKTYRFLRI